ncbi:tripartite-type tricarboxylate transporter receptor subunit TctC [Variovorax sp. 54]|uniref:tripartite tricarboxylate transporter substrate binding protein n=1 Tax=Variovorax sp. 54 TaxID=2035212 RepID=UPI000C198CD8|nr:tripartite tricarboxylate transporter substrate binding protein [Variovorax sp. 54]PIF73819.1 tripartite-type tricarboxylate transporter receptor subunit TctC [Variovorax sp. 54]
MREFETGRRRLLCQAIAAATAVAVPFRVSAGDFPSKPIRIVVPYPPGGASDITARILAQHMFAASGQPTVVENRTGASGIIGTDLVAKAPADGHTLAFVASSHVANQRLFVGLPYDALKSFAPITQVTATQLVVVVNATVPARSVPELVALARSKPGALTFASSGTGSNPHLFAELFAQRAGVKLTHVPYRGSTAAHPDLIGGQVDLMFDAIAAVLPHVQSGRMRALAVCGENRSALLPAVPTMSEAGVAGHVASSWGGILAPAGTPAPIVARLQGEIVRALALPTVRARLAQLGAEPIGNSSAAFEALLRTDSERYIRLIESLSIEPQQIK